MSVGATCFTSPGSNGGYWVVLVFPRLFFLEKGFFFPYATCAKKSLRDLQQKKVKFCRKKTRLTPKKKDNAACATKKSELRLFPQSSYAFLMQSSLIQPGRLVVFTLSTGEHVDGTMKGPSEKGVLFVVVEYMNTG